MRDAPDIDALRARLYLYYPRGIDPDDPRHQTSVQTRRLACIHEAAAIAAGKQYLPVPDDHRVDIDPEAGRVVDALRAWKTFGQRCREKLPGLVVWDETGPFFDPGFRYAAAKPGYVRPSYDWRDPVMCAVSALAPVFTIYTYDGEPDPFPRVRYQDFPARYAARIDTLRRLAEHLFGFAWLGGDVLRTRIRDIVPRMANRVMGEATLMDCVFTSCL